MGISRIAITIDQKVLIRLNQLVLRGIYRNRSQAIDAAVYDMLERLDSTRLARQLVLIDQKQEKSIAEGCIEKDRLEWPEF